MECMLCSSGNQAEFTAEMMIHYSGLQNINHPGVLLVLGVSVCLECGFSKFTIPQPELRKLKGRNTRSTSAS
jgi:hypothetical protein